MLCSVGGGGVLAEELKETQTAPGHTLYVGLALVDRVHSEGYLDKLKFRLQDWMFNV